MFLWRVDMRARAAIALGVSVSGFVLFGLASCGKESADPPPPTGHPEDWDAWVYDGPSQRWDSDPSNLYGDALTANPCSECVGQQCAAEYAHCDSQCVAILQCVDRCFVNCGDAAAMPCAVPGAGKFPSVSACVSFCYVSWDASDMTALLAGCLGDAGACTRACGR